MMKDMQNKLLSGGKALEESQK